MKKGFTLIELLVVIAIIGILSAVVLTNLQKGRSRAQDASQITGVREVAKAMELDRNASTGAFSTFSNTPTAAIGLQRYINRWPNGVQIIPNTSDNERYCLYTQLAANTSSYFVASESGWGFRDNTAPTITDCVSN